MDAPSSRTHNNAYSRHSTVIRPMQNEPATVPSTTITSNVNTKLRPIASQSSSPTNRVAHDSLKLTLIQTNGHSYVANNYPDSFSTHYNRWPIATQSPSIDYNIKWKIANNPFASKFNPSIETIPDSTVMAATSSPPHPHQTLPSSAAAAAAVPTVNVYRMYTDHRVHMHKHHTGHGYVTSYY